MVVVAVVVVVVVGGGVVVVLVAGDTLRAGAWPWVSLPEWLRGWT